MTPLALASAEVFDGVRILRDRAVIVADGRVKAVVPRADLPAGIDRQDLDGGILAPGFVDLQVNGGDGVLFNDAPTLDTLRRMARAHARLGATTILPTLITDTPEVTSAAIAAAEAAIAAQVPGIGGLHLEGPHLSLARKGAHAPHLIRPMEEGDLARLVDAADRLPILKVTVAPENVTPDQIRALTRAGILVSLGHSDCDFDAACAAVDAGAACVTHLFNAMSQLGNREPGLVGAALTQGRLSAGLIADLIHVHPQSLMAALAAKSGPGGIFLVSDAMATAGSDIDHFDLNGRRIERHGDSLTLADGTLAGAHLDLARAIRNLTGLGVELDVALAMATSVPSALIGRGGDLGVIRPGARADLVHLSEDGKLRTVWQGGQRQ